MAIQYIATSTRKPAVRRRPSAGCPCPACRPVGLVPWTSLSGPGLLDYFDRSKTARSTSAGLARRTRGNTREMVPCHVRYKSYSVHIDAFEAFEAFDAFAQGG